MQWPPNISFFFFHFRPGRPKIVTKFWTFGSQDDLVSLKPLTIFTEQRNINKVIFARVTSVNSSAANADISALSASEKMLPKCTLSFLQSSFCRKLRVYFGNFFSDAESAETTADSKNYFCR